VTEINFGARLKELRIAAGLSQPQLAERAGMNRYGVAKLEQGEREPTWATVQALAKALDVNCLAFTAEGTVPEPKGPPPRPGRPPKRQPDAEQAPEQPKSRGKGKGKKEGN
jgi:transcriptional regulator with XRE-family HTH domain